VCLPFCRAREEQNVATVSPTVSRKAFLWITIRLILNIKQDLHSARPNKWALWIALISLATAMIGLAVHLLMAAH
jgi:hypothetical protein